MLKYTEENGVYCIDCTNAVWSTDSIHEIYHNVFDGVGMYLSDVDFVIESEDGVLFLVEYKNANISNAKNPGAYKVDSSDALNKVAKKYYDSLHFLTLLGKTNPKQYVFVVETPYCDSVMRKRACVQLKRRLPFTLQEKVSGNINLIEGVDVLSIDEWNKDPVYGNYPITLVNST